MLKAAAVEPLVSAPPPESAWSSPCAIGFRHRTRPRRLPHCPASSPATRTNRRPDHFNNNLIRPPAWSACTLVLASTSPRTTGRRPAERPRRQRVGLLALRPDPGLPLVAGDLSLVPSTGGAYNIVATPVEFGARTSPRHDQAGPEGARGRHRHRATGQTWTEFDTAAITSSRRAPPRRAPPRERHPVAERDA